MLYKGTFNTTSFVHPFLFLVFFVLNMTKVSEIKATRFPLIKLIKSLPNNPRVSSYSQPLNPLKPRLRRNKPGFTDVKIPEKILEIFVLLPKPFSDQIETLRNSFG